MLVAGRGTPTYSTTPRWRARRHARYKVRLYGIMLLMPMNRNLTWGDRQAEAARDRNLKKLQKLAASGPAAAPPTPAEDSKPAAASAKKAKPAPKAAAKKSPVKAKKTS